MVFFGTGLVFLGAAFFFFGMLGAGGGRRCWGTSTIAWRCWLRRAPSTHGRPGHDRVNWAARIVF
jgi:hypothetical protein